MTLWNAGYSGAIYHCPKCSYTGPVVIELAEDKPSQDTELQVRAAVSSVSNTLDVVAVLFGLAFITIGLLTLLGLFLLPSIPPLPGAGFVDAFGLALLIVGVTLIMAGPLRLARMLRNRKKIP